MIKFSRSQTPLFALLGLIVFFSAVSVSAQRSPRPELLKNGRAVRKAFREVIRIAGDCTLKVHRAGGEQVSLGTIVASDGWILTKASQLSKEVTCELKDGRVLPARRVATNEDYDLALLKIDVANLSPVRWGKIDQITEGQWVVTPDLGDIPLAVGVVSVAPRKIPQTGTFLGIRIDELDDGRGPRIAQVFPNTAADEAGLKSDDIVTHVDGKRIRDGGALVAAIHQHNPGGVMELTILRKHAELRLRATLRQRKRGRGNQLQGDWSVRRSGFPQALQHDTPLDPQACGGPILNLKGEAVGINIARGGRTESFAVPCDDARSVLQSLLPKSALPNPQIPQSPRTRVVF